MFLLGILNHKLPEKEFSLPIMVILFNLQPDTERNKRADLRFTHALVSYEFLSHKCVLRNVLGSR